MRNDESIGELTESELRELIPQLQSLTEKYKRSELIQKSLYRISELSSSLDNFDSLYSEIHQIVAEFMTADNFFVAFYEAKAEKIQFAYFVDERDEEVVQTISYEKVKHGITGHILKSGKTLVLTKENIDQLIAEFGLKILGSPPVDLIGVPLLRGDQVIGAMVVQSYADNVRYDAEDLEILVFISRHIVTAIDRLQHREYTEALIEDRTQQLVEINSTLEEELKERERMENLQKALFEISELSTSMEDNIISFYTKLHGILTELINAKNCYIAVLDEKHENLLFPYFVGRDEDFNSTRKLTRGLTEYVIRSAEPLLVDSVKILALVESGEIERKFVVRMIEDANSWMGAPLSVDGEVQGVIAVQTYGEGEDYTETDLSLLQYVSHHISVALERRQAANELLKYNAQLSDKVQERTAELNKTNESLKRQIDQRKEVELKLIHDAHHDGLTNLPNRVMFNSRLELAIASKQRYKDHSFALLFIDLDRFKTINDTLGHHAGDEFLIEVSKRIGACKRSHDLLARLGGDEFVVLLDNFQNLDDVEAIAQRIVESVSSPFIIDDKEIYSGASIGIAEITEAYTDSEDALRDADAAMYQAKSLGRNRYVVFDMSMRNQLMAEIDDERAYRKAFKAGDFACAMQAVKNIDDNAILYYECTIAWPGHPKCSRSESFWGLADKCGLTYEVNKQLMQEAFRVLHTWRLDPEMKNTKLGVSLTVEHLLHKSSFEDLVHQIEISEINSELLVIELTESALSRFPKYLPSIIEKLQSLGVTLVLDNFGGQSGSLNHLFRYDFDFIKLNENLVNSFSMSDKYHKLVSSIVLIANQMGIGVIGAGVNDEMILHDLVEVGCHFAQGDYLDKPSDI